MIASIDSTSKAFSFVIILSPCTGYAPEGPPGARFSLFTFHQSPITSSRSAPGVTRTLDLRIRNPLLYPAELRAQPAWNGNSNMLAPLQGQRANSPASFGEP